MSMYCVTMAIELPLINSEIKLQICCKKSAEKFIDKDTLNECDLPLVLQCLNPIGQKAISNSYNVNYEKAHIFISLQIW